VYANLGKLYKQEGLFEQSIDNYRKSIELNGASAKIHNELGIVYIDAGRFEEALAQFQATVEIDPKSAQALLNLAKLHYHLGNKQAAYDAFNRILREFPAYESLARDYLNKL
jgi:tetratricopeptide (TPR) repeat protein